MKGMTMSTCTRSSSPTAPSRPRQRICNKYLWKTLFGICNKKYLASSTKIFDIYFKKRKTFGNKKCSQSLFSEPGSATRNICHKTRKSSSSEQKICFKLSTYRCICRIDNIWNKVPMTDPLPCCCNILWAKQTGMVWLRGIGKVR